MSKEHRVMHRVGLVGFCTAVAMLAFVAAYLTPGLAQQAARVSPDVYSQLHWRFIGPEGNRVSAVVGVPGDPLVYYAGSASGGIAKTVDGGVHWQDRLSAGSKRRKRCWISVRPKILFPTSN